MLIMSGVNVKCFDRFGSEIDVSSYQLAEEITSEVFLILDERMIGHDEERERLVHQTN